MTPLETAQAELDAYEASLLASIGLTPADGPVDGYLTENDFATMRRLEKMRERVSELMADQAA